MIQSIDDKIINSLSKCGRGIVFFPATFSHYAQPKAVNKALERMTDAGVIIRIANGIYCYPKIEKKIGLGILYPTFEEIARSIAKRDKARIAPAGAYAQNKLGLSSQIPMNVVYLTDGERRKVTIHDGRGIFFKHVAPRIFAFSDPLAQLLTIALKDIGNGNVTDEQKKCVKKLVNEHPRFSSVDMRLMPVWIRQLIMDLYD